MTHAPCWASCMVRRVALCNSSPNLGHLRLQGAEVAIGGLVLLGPDDEW